MPRLSSKAMERKRDTLGERTPILTQVIRSSPYVIEIHTAVPMRTCAPSSRTLCTTAKPLNELKTCAVASRSVHVEAANSLRSLCDLEKTMAERAKANDNDAA